MTFSLRSPGRSPHLIFLLAAGLIVILLSFVSCRQVSDPAQGLALNAVGTVDDCIAQCNATAAQRVFQQVKVHNILIFLAKGDPTAITTENARFQAALQQIEADRLACIAGCHHSGGASAGR